MTQEQQVIEKMRELGGFATFRQLNATVDFSSWGTKTPQASVRRIVQNSNKIFRIQPGLWALEDCRDEVLKLFELKIGNVQSEELFTHGYYQGLLVEIGKLNHQITYIPAQDIKSTIYWPKIKWNNRYNSYPWVHLRYIIEPSSHCWCHLV